MTACRLLLLVLAAFPAAAPFRVGGWPVSSPVDVRRRRATRGGTPARMTQDSFVAKQLEAIRVTFDELTVRLADPDVIGDSKLLNQISSQRASKQTAVELFDSYLEAEAELEGATELFQESGDDKELREMARAEIAELEERIAGYEEALRLELLPKDPNDERDCMLELRAGTGGSEANIWVGDLLTAYRKYAAAQGWKVAEMSSSPGDDGGFKVAVLKVRTAASDMMARAGAACAASEPALRGAFRDLSIGRYLATRCTRSSSTRQGCTGCSESRPLSRRDACTPRPRRWRSCPRWTRSWSRSIRRWRTREREMGRGLAWEGGRARGLELARACVSE